MLWYVLQTRTGEEEKLIDLIEGRNSESRVDLPVRLLQGKTT